MAQDPARRSEFDWLRILALGLMMLFHSCIGFSTWTWHVSDPHRSQMLGEILDFLWRWRVALVFVVSGAALMLALRNYAPREIMRERLLRLGIPLLFGIVVIVPPQVYYERLQRGQFHGSYFDYFPHFADGIYPAGNLSWHHLWFIPYLLALTAVGVPLLRWARSDAGRRRLDGLMAAIARRHLYWLLALPLAVAYCALRIQRGDAHTFYDDTHGWIEFATLMTLGAMLAEWPQVLAAVQRARYGSLVMGIACYATIKIVFPAVGDDPSRLPLAGAMGWSTLAGLNVLAWVLTVTGFATRLLTRSTPLLSYLNEATLPVYMLHQTLIVYAVYHLQHVNWPLGAKIFMTVSFSVLGSLALYEAVIRRSAVLRPLFGVKARAADFGLETVVSYVNLKLTSRWRAPSS